MSEPLSFAPASLPFLVAYAMRCLLPTAEQTALLRAALDDQEGAAQWRSWRAAHDLQAFLAQDHAGVKGLLPLLAYALEKHGVELTSDDRSLLRMARYREQLRMERYFAIMQQSLDLLRSHNIEIVVLKGAALAQTAYPDPTLRHCHDIDLLIHPRDLRRATDLLLQHGYRHSSSRSSLDQAVALGDVQLDHASGLPVVLHTRLFRQEFFDAPFDDFWRHTVTLGEGPQRMLAPEWALVHLLGTVLGTRAKVTWVCDAVYLLAATPTIDWSHVGALAAQCGFALGLYGLLAYLRDLHQIAIPSTLFDELLHHFTAERRASYEQILHCARQGDRVRHHELFSAADSWRETLFLLRWMLLPLPITAQRQQMADWQLPLFYMRRAVRKLARKTSAIRASLFRTVNTGIPNTGLSSIQSEGVQDARE